MRSNAAYRKLETWQVSMDFVELLYKENNHVGIALGSHAELETCIEIASRLGFVTDAVRDKVESHLGSIGRLLHALHESLEEKVRREKAERKPQRSRT